MIIHTFIGLPGAGKTYNANILLRELYCVADLGDVPKINLLHKVCAAKLDHVVITDPYLVSPKNRAVLKELADKYNYFIEETVFKNDLNTCWSNVQRRKDGRVISWETMRFFNKIFIYPDHCKIKEVYNAA